MKHIFIALLLTGLTNINAQTDSLKTRHFSTNETGLIYEYEHYNQPITRNWHYLSAFSSFKTGRFVLIPQFNWATRLFPSYQEYNDNGFQYQLDAYLKLSKRFYSFGSYAYSGSYVFAKHKTALELYGAIGHGWEASAGGRYTKFDSNIFSYTASIGKYIDNYWITLRATLLDGKYANSLQPSFALTGRKYFANEKDFLQVNLNYGIAAEEINRYYERQLANLLNSFGVGVSVKTKLYRRIVLQVGGSYRWEEYKGSSSRNVWGFQTALIYRH